jgi:hemerythrin-like domain-containing protein
MNEETAVDILSARRPANPMAVWHTEHAYFKRLLDLLHHQVEVFESGQRPNYGLMENILSYLRNYSDRYHHPREDVAFACLEEHCPDLAPTLKRLRQEHRVIATAGEKLLAQLEAILDEAILPRSEVEAAAATYLVYYRTHIDREERDVLTRAEHTLTEEDWDAVNAAVPAGSGSPLRRQPRAALPRPSAPDRPRRLRGAPYQGRLGRFLGPESDHAPARLEPAADAARPAGRRHWS